MRTSSGVFWIGSSDSDISRARGLLRALTQPGVLDELGFLVLLGAFSDRLYPAINTIMTRARYLVFVPAILRHIEERRLARTRTAEAIARDMQFDLCSALGATDATEFGIIGRQAGRDVARPPSNIYWSAFSELEIAASRTSEQGYYERVTAGASADAHMRDDDGNLHDADFEDFWDPEFRTTGVLTSDGKFPIGTSFELTSREATQLRERYDRLRPVGDTSLLCHLIDILVERPEVHATIRWPWDIPDLPSELRRITGHARLLSLLARGAQLQYHALLFEKRKLADTGTWMAFEAWWASCRKDLDAWDLQDFCALPFVRSGKSTGDVTFLIEWRDAVLQGNSARYAFLSAEARDVLRTREKEVRGTKGRLRSPFHLRQWRAPDHYDPADHFGLSYRQQTASRFAVDIAAGLQSARR